MKTFSVMTFNTLWGGQDRMERILQVIAQAQPDILVLQECLGWEDGVRLRQVAKTLGVMGDAHVQLGLSRARGSGSRYHVAVLSRFAFDSVQVHNDDHFIGHCIVEFTVEIDGELLTGFGTHFDAHHENLRFVEARYLRARLNPRAFANGLYVLTGDLNSISAKDPYPENLAEKVKAAGIDKYGHPPRFEVIAELEDFGWQDTLHLKGQPRSWVTAVRESNGVRNEFRTDYVFASPKLADRLVEAQVIELPEGVSDHNPVLARFRWGRG